MRPVRIPGIAGTIAMAPPQPKQIDGYAVSTRLGRGDFAAVYRVRQAAAEYALKLCHDGNDAARMRLRNEGEVLKRLKHRSIPRFIGANVWNERPYLVMSLMRGITLQAALAQRQADGNVFGDIEMVRAILGILQAVTYIHGKQIVHRDIKDANVMITASGTDVALLDFGFSKQNGATETRSSDSFWRVGAARFSPPAKLAHPGTAVTSHDIFAVGVLAYLMVTGTHPWNAPPNADVSRVRELQAQPAKPVNELNSRVSTGVAQFVATLIRTTDQDRPTAAEAVATARELLRTLEKAVGNRSRIPGRIQLPHVTRDPVHGDIRFTDDEWAILACPELQRLRWIRQLGLANLVYVGAEHSRLNHTLGCVHRVEQILGAIEAIEGVTLDRETRLTARMYALIHDVPHIAFGHTLEDELGFFTRHDHNAARVDRLILSSKSQLHEALVSSEVGASVLTYFEKDATVHGRSKVEEIVSGSTGADVLDYIDRDAFFCGLDHRVDSAIFRQFRLQRGAGDDDDHLVSLLYGKNGFRLDREHAVESLLRERYALFLKVYTHARKAAASALLGQAITAEMFRPRRGKSELSEQTIEWLGDDALLRLLQGSRVATAKSAAERLLRRMLPRPIYRARLLREGDRDDAHYKARKEGLSGMGLFDPRARAALEASLAKDAKLDSHEVLVYCAHRAPGYSRIEHWLSGRPGGATPLDQASGPYLAIRQQHLALWELWVFSCNEDGTSDARLDSAASQRFGFENLVRVDRRHDALF